MRGKFLAFKLIAVFVTVLGIASAVVGALFGNTIMYLQMLRL